MSRYRLSALAESDLDDIWLRIAQDASTDTADQVISDIVTRFALLSEHPHAGSGSGGRVSLREPSAGLQSV
jgi:plasmid stabilization system protein ParE